MSSPRGKEAHHTGSEQEHCRWFRNLAAGLVTCDSNAGHLVNEHRRSAIVTTKEVEQLDTADLLGKSVWLEEYEKVPAKQIATGPRIGIDYAEEWVDKPWRFWIKGNAYVSRR